MARAAVPAQFPDQCLHDLFEGQATITPEAIAVVAGDRQVTYRELDVQARRVAAGLRAAGVGPGMAVGVFSEHSAEVVAALLGILQTGAAYVPLDPAHPEARLAHALDDVGLTVVLTRQELRDRLRRVRPRIIALDLRGTLRETPAACPASSRPRVDPDGPAYIIYTSGSTGRPKGVTISHRGAVNTVVDVNRRFRVGPGDRLLALNSLSFDLSVYDVFGLLAAGGTLVIPPPSAARDVGAWAELLARHQVTLWNSVPAMMEMLVGRLEAMPGAALGSLRLALLSGDWIPLRLPRRIAALQPRACTISLGGATEASIWSVFYPIDGIAEHWKSVPYGRPLSNQQVYVLDERLQPCPVGVPGEICIGGAGVALGYWDRPELTAARFVADPWSSDPRARLFRTGDRGRYLPDGNLELLGRLDQQIKLHGFRIEPGEIEAALSAHPAVRASAVAVRPDPRGGKQLIAYVVTHRQASWAPDELRAFLGERLPPYMLPTRFQRLDALPLGLTGKTDRTALPAPAPGEFVPPRGDIERRLCRIWEQFFERERCGADDDFFELGGDSLLAVALLTRVEQEFHCRLLPNVLVECPTVRQLAGLLGGEQPRAEDAPVVTLWPGGPAPPLFCLPGIGGDFIGLRKLAAELAPDRPVLGLRLLRAWPADRTPQTIEELSSAVIAQLREVQRQGPYHLLGYSLGGSVAFEMARQLHAAGETVALLVLLDTPRKLSPAPLLPSWGQWCAHWRNLRGLAGRQRLRYLADGARLLAGRLRRALAPRCLQGREGDDPAVARRVSPAMRPLARSHARMLRAYEAGPYAGRLVLVRAAVQGKRLPAALRDSWLGWRQLVRGGIAAYEVPGTHRELFRPESLAVIAEALRRHLEAASASEADARDG